MPYIDKRIQKVYIPRKGIGYVAKDNIEEGTIIIKETPAYWVPNLETDISRMFQLLYIIFTDNDQSKNKQFNKLVPLNLNEIDNNSIKIHNPLIDAEYDSLAKYNPKIYKFFKENYEMNEIYLFCYKYMRNAFEFKNYGPCVLLIGSRLNHSCDPNITFTRHKNTIYYTTNRKISNGDEINITYIKKNLALNKKQRAQRLLNQYGFECKCQKCITN